MSKTISKSKGSKKRASDLEFRNSAPEIMVFLALYGLIYALKEAYTESVRTKETVYDFSMKISPLYLRFRLAVEATSRFDLVLPIQGASTISTSLWRWYNWWDDYVKTLTPHQLEVISGYGKVNDPEVEKFRPDGDWIGYRADSSFTLVSV